MNRKVAVLCSGFGLGFYVPGLLIDNNLIKNGINSKVFVFEDYLLKSKRDNIVINKKAYHDNFKAALVAQRMHMDIRESIDNEKLEELLDAWKQEEIENFIVLSGHWIFVVEEFKRRNTLKKINAEIVYIDCSPSPSWKSLNKYMPEYSIGYEETYLFDYDNSEIKFGIPIYDNEIIPFDSREDRFMIHGGGWGMGTYKERIPELEKLNYKLDIIAYKEDEAINQKQGNRYFMVDPKWTAWGHEEGKKAMFPPFGEIKNDRAIEFSTSNEYHLSFDIAKQCKAMISKPGGGTLIDSLNACTPIILLEPFGNHEKKNMELWEKLGFGISYEKWRESGFNEEILRKIHNNLVSQRKITGDFVAEYINKIFKLTLVGGRSSAT